MPACPASSDRPASRTSLLRRTGTEARAVLESSTVLCSNSTPSLRLGQMSGQFVQRSLEALQHKLASALVGFALLFGSVDGEPGYGHRRFTALLGQCHCIKHFQRPGEAHHGMPYDVSFFVRIGNDADDALRWNDFAVDPPTPYGAAIRHPHRVLESSTGPQIYFAIECREALGTPPMHQVARVGNRLPYQIAWRLEDPSDHAPQAFRGDPVCQ